MKKDILKAQIIDTLDAIIEQTQIITNHSGEIPQIEIDLVKRNILELYQNFHFLDKMNNVNISKIIEDIASSETIDNEEEKPETPIIDSVENSIKEVETEKLEEENTPEETGKTQDIEKTVPAKEESIAESAIEKTIHIPKIEEEIIPKKEIIEANKVSKIDNLEPSLFSETEEIKPRKTEKPKIAQEAKSQTHSTNAQVTIADKFKTEKKSIHDTIEQNGDTSIASKLQKAPINDLVKAIGLNDRFFLTKELFKNNAEKYNESIKTLNEIPDLDQAFDYLDDLKTKLEWDENSSACLKIYDLIRRKHQNKK
ncbi:MAG: hypothetical protein RBS19_02950 [Bacteroidales bacterium]|nr:hypothetical protein [Bacteroidales bacterium]MDY0215894.1 hypothetical protein [Bacteroidales bacterium]